MVWKRRGSARPTAPDPVGLDWLHRPALVLDRVVADMEKELTPSWKSFLYAIAGAYLVACSIIVYDNPHVGGLSAVAMSIWGVCFWAGGIGNLFVDRRIRRKR